MKKLILVLLVVFSTMTLAVESHLRFGGITNAQDYHGEDKFSTFAPAMGLEVTQSLLFFDVGAGIQHNSKVDGTDVATTPVYGLVKWNIIPIGVKPYLVAKLGRSVYSSDSVSGSDPEGKDFYGVGAGISVSALEVELFYSVTKLDDSGRRSDNMKQLSLMAGYRIF